MAQTAWHVYLNGDQIDTVFYDAGLDKRYVEDSLINHDGYDCRIKCFRGNPHGDGCNPLPTKAAL